MYTYAIKFMNGDEKFRDFDHIQNFIGKKS